MQEITLRLVKYNGILSLGVECPVAHRATVSLIKGFKHNKKHDIFIYPLEAITQFFERDFPVALHYNDEVYLEYKRQRSRDMLAERLISGEATPQPHKFLMHHQRVARDIAGLYNRFALFMDTGTGKTLTALQIIKDKQLDESCKKWLVVVPRPIIRTGWMADAIDFFPDIKMFPASTNYNKTKLLEIAEMHKYKRLGRMTSTELSNMLFDDADVVVINPESASKILGLAQKRGIHFDGIIVDESTKIKTHNSGISKLMMDYAYRPETKFFYILTGNPRPQSELDYWSQMFCIDYTLLGASFTQFRGMYFDKIGEQFSKYVMRKSMKDYMAKLIAMKSYTVRKEDCLDLLTPQTIIREVEMSPTSKKLYKTMLEQFIVMVKQSEDDKTITTMSKVGALMKVRQITSGFIMDTDTGKPHRTGETEKLSELKSIVEELGDKPVVIWITFKEEAEMIAEKLGRANCAVANSQHDTDESLRRFMDNEVQFLIAHPASIKYGVTLTGRKMKKNCTYAIYFSRDANYENYDQSKDRIQRYGQTEQVTYIHIVTERSIDADIYRSVMNKQTESTFMAGIIEQYSKGGTYEDD